ncbi:hypothetical protein [Chromohalobacter sp. 48-RD10]|uniref:hypothetical protein n=1 Tax=Chromohalobacter sp. 48-RD10 TaxID=2994063 RepID=UPI0024697C62|nr:hypothetical protein [Chromohalobacter sp. 48-RD10]
MTFFTFFYTPLAGSPFGIEATLSELSIAKIITHRELTVSGGQQRVMLPSPPVVLRGPDIPGHHLLNSESVLAQIKRMKKHDQHQIDTLMVLEVKTENLVTSQLELLHFLLGPLQRAAYFSCDPISKNPCWKQVIEQIERSESLRDIVSFYLYQSEKLETRHYEHLLGGLLSKSSIEKWLRSLRYNQNSQAETRENSMQHHINEKPPIPDNEKPPIQKLNNTSTEDLPNKKVEKSTRQMEKISNKEDENEQRIQYIKDRSNWLLSISE